MSERRNQRETTENGQNYTPENQQGAPNGQNYGPYGQPNQGNPYGGQNGYQQGPYSQNRQNYGPNQNRQGRSQGGPGYNQNRGQAGPGYGQQRQQGAYRGQGGSSPYYQNRQGAPYPGQRPPKKKKKGHRNLFFVLEVLVLVILALYRTLAQARAVRRRRAQALRHALEHWVYGPHRTRGPAPPPYSRE